MVLMGQVYLVLQDWGRRKDRRTAREERLGVSIAVTWEVS